LRRRGNGETSSPSEHQTQKKIRGGGNSKTVRVTTVRERQKKNNAFEKKMQETRKKPGLEEKKRSLPWRGKRTPKHDVKSDAGDRLGG